MNLKISFGLPEIFSIFGSYALIQSNYLMGSILLATGLFSAFVRFGMETQAKKENSEKINSAVNSFVEAFAKPTQAWFSNNSDVH